MTIPEVIILRLGKKTGEKLALYKSKRFQHLLNVLEHFKKILNLMALTMVQSFVVYAN